MWRVCVRAREKWLNVSKQYDDSSAPNVLYHFSIPFYLALDIFRMQTHSTIHLFVIVFAVDLRLFFFSSRQRQHSRRHRHHCSFFLFRLCVRFFSCTLFSSSFLLSLHVFLSVELPFNVSTFFSTSLRRLTHIR